MQVKHAYPTETDPTTQMGAPQAQRAPAKASETQLRERASSSLGFSSGLALTCSWTYFPIPIGMKPIPLLPSPRESLPVRKLVRLEPVACYFCQRFLVEAMPTFFYAQAPGRTPKHPKGACPMNSLQQFLPHLFAMLRLCEFIHNRPLMNPEAVRQLQAAAARHHGADLLHHLALPFRAVVLSILRLFCQTPYFLCRSDDLTRVWIQVGKAILALHLQCLDDLSKRNDSCHAVPRCCRSNPHGRKAIIATIARHSKRSPKRFFRDSHACP